MKDFFADAKTSGIIWFPLNKRVTQPVLRGGYVNVNHEATAKQAHIYGRCSYFNHREPRNN